MPTTETLESFSRGVEAINWATFIVVSLLLVYLSQRFRVFVTIPHPPEKRPVVMWLFLLYATIPAFLNFMAANVMQRWGYFFTGMAYLTIGLLFMFQDWVVDFGHWLRVKTGW